MNARPVTRATLIADLIREQTADRRNDAMYDVRNPYRHRRNGDRVSEHTITACAPFYIGDGYPSIRTIDAWDDYAFGDMPGNFYVSER